MIKNWIRNRKLKSGAKTSTRLWKSYRYSVSTQNKKELLKIALYFHDYFTIEGMTKTKINRMSFSDLDELVFSYLTFYDHMLKTKHKAQINGEKY